MNRMYDRCTIDELLTEHELGILTRHDSECAINPQTEVRNLTVNQLRIIAICLDNEFQSESTRVGFAFKVLTQRALAIQKPIF